MSLDGVLKLVVDFHDVTYINSIGVKNWILWTLKFPPDLQLQLKKCTSLIINQINIVRGFLPLRGYVESFYVPYFCESCSTESKLLVTRGREFMEAKDDKAFFINLPKEMKCPRCEHQMLPDLLPSKYYRFLEKPMRLDDFTDKTEE